jgi:hypothetical protein
MASAEQKKSYAIIKAFKGLNTKANRMAIDKEEFSWIENAMPIGSGNIRIVALPISNVTHLGVVLAPISTKCQCHFSVFFKHQFN